MSDSPWTDEDIERVLDALDAVASDGPLEMADVAGALLLALVPRVAELQRTAKVEARREAARESVDERRALSLGTLRVAADELRQAGHAASADILEQSVREMETN